MSKKKDVLARRLKIVAVLRAISIAAGVYQLINEPLVGVAILACVAAISFPSWITRNRVKAMPLEFELILFAMIVLQLVIGETLNFYDNVPYFDKFVHFMLPFFLGFIATMFAYTMRVTGALKASLVPTMFVVFMVTLGIGAVWEIIEYLADVFLGTYLQGSHTASPLVDTMNDLIVDTLGGVFGALLTLVFIRRNGKDRESRLPGLVDEIKADF